MDNHIYYHCRFISSKAIAVLAFVLFILTAPTVPAANLVDISPLTCRDTIRTSGTSSFLSVAIENDVDLKGLCLAFKIWSPDGAGWIWNDVDGYGPEGIGTGKACVTIAPGSRMDSPEDVFDLTGLVVVEYDVDQTGSDVIRVGGASLSGGLTAGPLEPMFYLNFTATGDYGDNNWVGTMCFDSISMPPYDDFVFADADGYPLYPVTLWPQGGLCYPVKCYIPCALAWDYRNPSELTIDHCDGSGSVLLRASALDEPIIFTLSPVVGGLGTAQIQGSGNNLTLYYTPDPGDVGRSITLEVWADCYDYPLMSGAPWSVTVNVTDEPPEVEGGLWHNAVGINSPFVKTDIFGSDPDGCDELEYAIVSGPGQIDPATGLYTWTPAIDDIGTHFVYISAFDGSEAAIDSFYLGVIDTESYPGNANCNDGVDVADAIFLLNYIFKGGAAPPIMNWADPNADCQVNVGDVVTLINYIFRSGSAPLDGCYN